MSLSVANNKLTSLPKSIGQLDQLVYLHAWNNSLVTLPSTLGQVESLKVVDVRHNRLQQVSLDINVHGSMEPILVAGNPFCDQYVSAGTPTEGKVSCERQCSIDCPSDFLGDSYCDDNEYTFNALRRINLQISSIQPKPDSGCNTNACGYDGGDCLT